MQGWGVSCRWGAVSCRGGMGHVGVGVSCSGAVGHAGVGWGVS